MTAAPRCSSPSTALAAVWRTLIHVPRWPVKVASYWTQTASSLTVTLGVIVTNDLSDADTESTSTFDLSTASNHLTTFTGQRGTWIRVRHTAASAVEGLEHRGAAVICWPLNMR